LTLENDINLAALGEHWFGVAEGVDDFVFVSVVTGLGAGLVLHGELHRGHHGAAGELDYALTGFDEDVDCAPGRSPSSRLGSPRGRVRRPRSPRRSTPARSSRRLGAEIPSRPRSSRP